MKKTRATIVALVLAIMMAIPTIAIAQTMDDVPQRTENGVVYVALRLTAYAHGATVEWNGETRTVYITDADGNKQEVIVEAVGGFIEDGTSWIPLELANLLFQREGYNDVAEIAFDFMAKFAAGDIQGMFQMMSAEMQAVGAEVFAGLHQMALLQRGSFIGWDIADSQTAQGFYIFDFTVNSVIGVSTRRIIVNADGEIADFTDLGFVLVPIPVAEDAAYTAEPVIIGEGTQWALDGLLTIPNEASAENPVPAVVLVHGSGANNMDTSIFDNRPFHDIATHLSSNGIAVLRYNERGFTHGAVIRQYFGIADGEVGLPPSILWEYQDAFLAIEILQADPRISRVYVAGHSLGGFVASHIAEESEADGVILLAGSPRPIHYMLFDQSVQALNDTVLAGLMTQEAADELIAMIAAFLEEAQNLQNLTEEEVQGMMVWGGSLRADYVRSLYDILPLPIISRNIIPTLILHPDGDFQVFTDPDFNMFVEHTRDYAHVQTILYYNLNHLFMPVQTPFNDIREYAIPGNVCEQVLRDIVEWIHAN